MNRKKIQNLKQNLLQNQWFDTPVFLILIHTLFLICAVLISSQLYSYKIETLKFDEAQKNKILNKNTLEEIKSKNGYLSSHTFVLKSAKQNYIGKKVDGENVLDVSKLQNGENYSAEDYLPDEVKNKLEKVSDLWRKCWKFKESESCNLK